MKKFIFNPISGNFDAIFNVPELSSDPASPANGDMWVLKTGGSVSGGGEVKAFLGLGFPFLTKGSGSGSASYELKFKTVSDGIKKVGLT